MENRRNGLHLVGTLINCDSKIITDYESLYSFLCEFPIKIGMTVVAFPENPMLHRVQNDHGFMGVVLLYESHFSFHCWPEADSSIDFDLFSCKKFDDIYAMQLLIDFFKGSPVGCVLLGRGYYGAKILNIEDIDETS